MLHAGFHDAIAAPGGKVGCDLLGPWRINLGAMCVQQISQYERPRSLDDQRLMHAEAGPHPAVFADVPMRRIPRIGGMIEVGDTFDSAGSHRAAVIHPARRLAKDGRLAAAAFAVGQLTAAEISRDVLGHPHRQKAEVGLRQFQRLSPGAETWLATPGTPLPRDRVAPPPPAPAGAAPADRGHPASPTARRAGLHHRRLHSRAIAAGGCALECSRPRNRCPAPCAWANQMER